MKRILTLALLLCSAYNTFAQSTVSGTVMGLNSQPVINHYVVVMPDSNRQGSGTFIPIKAITNTQGKYSVTLPSNLPNNSGIAVITEDCKLIMHQNTHTYSGSNITSNFTICSTPNPPSSISGVVYTGNVKRKVEAVVYRIEKCIGNPTTLTLIDSVLTDTFGAYKFNNYPTISSGCQLLMKAALLPSSVDYKNYLPSYFVSLGNSSLKWSGAGVVTKSVAANGVDIRLIAGNNPGGPGFIGGSVLQGANKGTGPGDPLAGKLVLLTDDMDNAIGYTYSDANGKFGFSNLAYGTYKLFGDSWGKDNPELKVTISPNTPDIKTIKFYESSKKFEGNYVPASVNTLSATYAQSIKVYPNPVNDVLNIKGLDNIDGTKTVTLTNITGAVVYSGVAGNGKMSISTSELSAGIYILKVDTEAGAVTYKIIK